MAADDSLEALVTQLRRARSGLREAIELAAGAWERARRPRPGELEVWTPRQVAEHALAADTHYAGVVARTVDGADTANPERAPLVLPSAAAALGACEHAGERFAAALAALSADQLILETELGVEVGDVLRAAAAHLREHARQLAGVEQR